MGHRIEKDSIGEIKVPSNKYYGAQTERSIENFPISCEKIPLEIIYAYAQLKKACAIVNYELQLLPQQIKDFITYACDEILSKKYDDNFPLSVWQTGSGTQTNMNVNEVISNLAIQKVNGTLGSKDPVHPNDHVNMGQSSNDTFPTVMHISAKLLIEDNLIPSIKTLQKGLLEKSKEFSSIIKVGRTHLMDATPITLGQEFSGYVSQLEHVLVSLQNSLKGLSELAIGGTAVGTGINTHPEFGKKVSIKVSELTGSSFTYAENKFSAISANEAILSASSSLKMLATALMKIGNDIRLSASGPRCGISELNIPANEPGSSIMPGKVNPTQIEALYMACIQVIGNDIAITLACSQGHFQLNACRPSMIYNLLQSIHLMSDICSSFYERCLKGIMPNHKKIEENLNRSLMLATALNRSIGYDKASQIVKKAHQEDITLKEAALSLGLLTEQQFNEIIDPKKMI